jgi:hypothetical protein
MKCIGMAIFCASLLAGCGSVESPSIEEHLSNLSGCNGIASSSIPSDGNYYLTTFGGGSDSGTMSCGSNTNHGSWYYAASRQRYGCGAHVKIEANGKCVIAQADDYGPDVCVEDAAGGPIMDVSPLVSQDLFGSSSAGWSDHFGVHVTLVAASNALGPCQGAANGFLKGVVYLDPDISSHLAGAKVTVEKGPSTTYDGTNVWSFELAPGTYKVTATLAGYEPGSVTRDVAAGQEIWGSIGLKPVQHVADAAMPNEPKDSSTPDVPTISEAGGNDAANPLDASQDAQPTRVDAVVPMDAVPNRDTNLDSWPVAIDGPKAGSDIVDAGGLDGAKSSGGGSGCSCQLGGSYTGGSPLARLGLLLSFVLLLQRRNCRK